MPEFASLKTLYLSNNNLKSRDIFYQIAKKCPNLEHLNLMRNQINPMFQNKELYKKFRARFKIWIPSLETLDGVNFNDDTAYIESCRKEIEAEKDGKLGATKSGAGVAGGATPEKNAAD